jgi:hypothetical protein
MFFLPRRRPLELTAQRVRALRPSLNTPVVAAADLPVGPACAAILVHVEPGHGLQISVGVRSLACGSVAIYGFDGPISSSVVGVALDAALSFAEGMGFLFDDDVVGDDDASREKAVLRWQEMIGDGTPVTPAPSYPSAEELFEPDGGELTDPASEDEYGSEPSAEDQDVFERGVGPVPFAGPETAAPGAKPGTAAPSAKPGTAAPSAARGAAAPLEGGVALSKFRVQPAAEADAAAPEPTVRAPSKRPLGRMRLVKRRAGEPAQDARRAWLLRLLTSF